MLYHLDFEQNRDGIANQQNSDEKYKITQVFHLGFDNANRQGGDNDFIELRSGDDEYIYPHKLIEFTNLQGQQVQEQSNGIWFTKARADTEHIFRYTPDANHVARCSVPDEAQYSDGEYTLRFFAQDDWGRVNRAANAADVNAKVTVIVDNFRPFVKQVEVVSGDRNTRHI